MRISVTQHENVRFHFKNGESDFWGGRSGMIFSSLSGSTSKTGAKEWLYFKKGSKRDLEYLSLWQKFTSAI